MARPVKLPPAAEAKVLAQLGTRAPDPPPRKVRLPHPEFARGLDTQCKQQGLPLGVPEYQFDKYDEHGQVKAGRHRQWRFDRAWPDRRIAVEIDGAAFKAGGGRHTRGAGYRNDCRKYATALLRGWRVLRVTTDMVQKGEAVAFLGLLLKQASYSARSYSGDGRSFRVDGGPGVHTTMGWHVVNEKGFTVAVSCDHEFLKVLGITVQF